MRLFEKSKQGFSLVEVLIALAIVGILTAVAYPAYTRHVAETNRTEGQRELIRLSQLMEQFFLDRRRYTEDMTELGMGADPFITEYGTYSIDAAPVVNDVIATSFVLTAQARGLQFERDTGCETLTLNHLGVKTPAECWR